MWPKIRQDRHQKCQESARKDRKLKRLFPGTFPGTFGAYLIESWATLAQSWPHLALFGGPKSARTSARMVPLRFSIFPSTRGQTNTVPKKTRPKQQVTSQPSGRPTPKAGNAENKTAKRAQGQKNRAPQKNTATAAGNQPASQQFGKPALKAGATEIRPFLNEPTRPLRTWLASQPEPMPELSDH